MFSPDSIFDSIAGNLATDLLKKNPRGNKLAGLLSAGAVLKAVIDLLTGPPFLGPSVTLGIGSFGLLLFASARLPYVSSEEWQAQGAAFESFKHQVEWDYKIYPHEAWNNEWTPKLRPWSEEGERELAAFYKEAVKAGALLRKAVGAPLKEHFGNGLAQQWLNIVSQYQDTGPVYFHDGKLYSVGVLYNLAALSAHACVEFDKDPLHIQGLRRLNRKLKERKLPQRRIKA